MESWIHKMKTLKKIDSLIPKKGEVFLLDTCILMYNFYTAGDYKKFIVKRCNDLFSKIIKADAKILIFPELMLEFFNLFIKLEYDMYLKKHGLCQDTVSYKNFRKTDEFQNVVAELREVYLSQIKPYAIVTNSNIKADDVFGFLDAVSELDLNDLLICKVAKNNNANLITRDNDFLLSSLADSINLYYINV